MEMHQVRYFLVICEEGNFTRAAKRCGVKQPSLTRAIQRLETEFGAPLFIRTRTGATLSHLGRLVRTDFLQIEASAARARATAKLAATKYAIELPNRQRQTMSRRFLLSAVALISLLGVGAIAASRLHSSPAGRSITPPVSIDPYQIQATINPRMLPQQRGVSLF
jgi:DNA-binding transcriptional LysR family regulator